MKEIGKVSKIFRVMRLYSKLINGHVINKASAALELGVDERSIQRDISVIKSLLAGDDDDMGVNGELVYDREADGFRIDGIYKTKLTNSEILAICKILLDSRAFTKTEMQSILERLINCCVPENNRKLVKGLISNEEEHYIELQHKTVFMDKMWDIGQAIREHRYIEIDYLRNKDKAIVTRKLKPMAIMFSEFYFYMTAFIDDKDEAREDFDVLNDSFPTIYRIDRIKRLKVCKERYKIPNSERFEEGEFRKRIQFMYGGKIQRVKFKYSGENIEAVLDRLPTAKILSEENGVYTVSAEVFGKGIDMWLRSQGEKVEII